MENFWNERYSDKEYVYGKEANNFLKQELVKLNKGKILFPCDGEGRNGVFASKIGWEVYSFDQSEEGKKKAENLAKEYNVYINYIVENLSDITYNNNYFDSISYIYSHFYSIDKEKYFKKLDNYLKINGHIIFEAFSKEHLKYNSINPSVGGPKDIDLLYSIDEIKKYFNNYDILYLKEEEIELNEGKFHKGLGKVIRFLGKKIS